MIKVIGALVVFYMFVWIGIKLSRYTGTEFGKNSIIFIKGFLMGFALSTSIGICLFIINKSGLNSDLFNLIDYLL